MPCSNKLKHNEYQRLRIQKRRASYFKDKYCNFCSSIENLELDHIDPKTKVSHYIWAWSLQRIDIELAKCQILCRSCHRNKTKLEQTTHGVSSYKKRKCRCHICKLAMSLSRKRYKESLSNRGKFTTLSK